MQVKRFLLCSGRAYLYIAAYNGLVYRFSLLQTSPWASNMLGMARSEGTKSMDLWSSFRFGVLSFVRHYRFISSKTIVLCITVLVGDLLGWISFQYLIVFYFQSFGGFCWNKFAEESRIFMWQLLDCSMNSFCSFFRYIYVAVFIM